MIEQPDFGSGFHRTDDRPIRYTLQSDENRLHDLVYLAGFMHEAGFLTSGISVKGDRFSLRMERIRREFFRHHNDLCDIGSELVVTRIRDFRVHSIELCDMLPVHEKNSRRRRSYAR